MHPAPYRGEDIVRTAAETCGSLRKRQAPGRNPGVTKCVRSSGPGYVSWVMLSTVGAAGAYTRVRDTGSINNQGISQDMLGFLVHPTSNTANAPGAAGDEQRNVIYNFRPPARFTNGITMLKSATDTSAVICTRLYGTSSP